jgi:phosphoribosylaminoimidazole-succinocarboxamide synthase
MANVVLQTAIDGVEGKHGKVRDIYDLGDSLLIAASDRLSAFDVIMTSGIPYKGQVLTQISKFWFEFLDLLLSRTTGRPDDVGQKDQSAAG